jgi:hypothetical protein
MDTHPSFACSLDPSELRERTAQMSALADSLVGIQHTLSLRFRPDPQTLAGVETFVAAEERCCAFLDFEIARDPAETVLTITAPHGAEEILAEMARRTAG